MKYEVVTLEKKYVVGISNQTSNEDADMTKKIGELWTRLYGNGIYGEIKNKVNEFAIGLYSDYDDQGYTVTVGTEVSAPANEELVTKVIPAGQYAKFVVEGEIHQAVGQAWQEIWGMDLNRSYAADFEEYVTSDCEHGRINIYISLK